MRQIVNIKLENDINIYVIANVSKYTEAKTLAIKHSPRLIKDDKLNITSKSKIISHENWEQSRISNSANGNKIYRAMFYLNNITQCVDINAVSIKSAYNNIKIKYGIEENLFMIIYDTSQLIKKKSALEQSKNIYTNVEEVSNLLKITANKVKITDELNTIKTGISILLNMIKDIYTGKYKIPDEQIIATIGCLIYFNEPYTTTQDIIKGANEIDDIGMMKLLISTLEKQLIIYNNYTKQCNKRNTIQ